MNNAEKDILMKAGSATHRISDYHLGAGSRFANGVPNLLEDFKGDEDYVRMLRGFVARFRLDASLTLEWGGDMVDFHAIPYQGACTSVPTVEAALAKLEACLAGHPAFWAATRHFLADAHHALVVTIGNHDLAFAWPEVQGRIRSELGVSDDDSRLRFVTAVIEGDTCKLHGDLFDPPNAIPTPDRLFVTDLVDGQLRQLLNVSYGNILSASFVQALKTHQPWIGRMGNHGAVWIASLTREWHFGLKAIALWIGYIVQHRFFAKYRYLRHQASLRQAAKLALSTLHEDRPEAHARGFLARHPQIRFLESGHTHVPGVTRLDLGDRTVDWFNTGTGIEQIRLVRPEFALCLTPWPKIESFVRRIGLYWRLRTAEAIGLALLHLAVALAPFAVERALGWRLDWLAWAIVAVAVFSWLSRQSFAFYAAEARTEYVVLETLEGAAGRPDPQLLSFDSQTNEYRPFRTSQTTCPPAHLPSDG